MIPDDLIIARMQTFKEWKNLTKKEIISRIVRGQEIMDEDERVLNEKGVLRSHYHLPFEDREAMGTASQYNIMLGFATGAFSEEE